MVVHRDLEFCKGAGVDEAEAVSLVLFYGELCQTRIVVTGIPAVISI